MNLKTIENFIKGVELGELQDEHLRLMYDDVTTEEFKLVEEHINAMSNAKDLMYFHVTEPKPTFPRYLMNVMSSDGKREVSISTKSFEYERALVEHEY